MNIVTGRSAIVKLVIVAVFAAVIGILALTGGRQRAAASASGPSPSHTDAPGEDNCTSCHIGSPVNSGTGSITIGGIPHDYLPGQQVTITVTTSQSDATIYGFQLTAIDSVGRQVGTFTLPTQNPAKTQIVDGFVEGNLRLYVEHTVDGLSNGGFGSNSWTFTWTAPAQRKGKVRFYAAGNAANSDGNTTGDFIYTKATASLSGSAISNFDGDFQSDLTVFRPSTGYWYSFSIATGATQFVQFGQVGDKVTPGDYDGDGQTDQAVFRPSTGTWYIQRSTLGFTGVQFGATGDLPAAGDYDGDGKTDVAIYRPSTGFWYLLRSTAGFSATSFGLNGDKPAQGDFDADGKTDIAVFRPSTGVWYLNRSTDGFAGVQFGASEDRPVQSDYDGDGKADIAVFRPSTGAWYIIKSTDGLFGLAFGISTDLPAPADYDGDGKTDVAVFRPSNGTWYITRSTDNSFYAVSFGINGDVPIPAGYIAE